MSNTGEHTEKLRASNAIDDVEVVSGVEARLTNLRELTGPIKREPEASDGLDDPNSDQDDQKASDKDINDSNPDDEVKDDEVKDDEVKDDEVKNDEVKDGEVKKDDIPYAYEQAALRSGWSQEDIDEAITQDSEKAKKMFGNLYESVNKASREWSLLGRAKLEQQQQQNDVNVSDKKTDKSFDGVDITALKKEYEDNPIVDGVVVPLNNALKELSNEMRAMKANQNLPQVDHNATARANTTAEIALQQQIDNFFGADPMKPYNEFYGSVNIGQDWNDLSNGQRQNRWNVLTEADSIIAGHASIGNDIDPVEAMNRAHLLVTESVREKIIRSDIKKSVTKRNNSITMRPSENKRTSSSNEKFDSNRKPKDRKELEAQVSEKLRSVFN